MGTKQTELSIITYQFLQMFEQALAIVSWPKKRRILLPYYFYLHVHCNNIINYYLPVCFISWNNGHNNTVLLLHCNRASSAIITHCIVKLAYVLYNLTVLHCSVLCCSVYPIYCPVLLPVEQVPRDFQL